MIIRYLLKPLAVAFLFLSVSFPAFAASKLNEDLIYNANFGTPEKVAALLEAGANPNAVGEDGWPAVSLATMRSDKDGTAIVKLLISNGANLNVRDANGETPLMNAISVNNAELVKYMIEYGADFRAINKKGTTVRDFAHHYGNKDVVFVVNEAIRLEQKRIREGRSRKHMYRMLDDYIYYNCAMQYIAFNQAVELYPESRREKVQQLLDQVLAKLGNAQLELRYNFRMGNRDLNSISEDVQEMVSLQLQGLISNRNRLKHGVGSDTDLDKRCKDILELWRPSYQEYEQDGRIIDR